MNVSVTQLLKANVDKLVKIYSRDGEILVARILHVSDEDEDAIYEIFSTNQESRYREHGRHAAYLIRIQDIESVETVLDPPEIST